MMSFIKDFLKEEEGLAAVEYAVLAGIVVAGVLTLDLSGFYEKIQAQLDNITFDAPAADS